MTLIAGYDIAWAARQYRDRTAVVFGGHQVTFAAINRRANRLANALRGLGLRTGDRVAVLMHNSLPSVETVLGVNKAGLCYLALNVRHSRAEHADILNDAAPTALIAGPEFEADSAAIAPQVPSLKAVIGSGWRHGATPDYEALLARAADSEPNIAVQPTDLVRLTYTSGTTGRPKGVAYDYRQYFARLGNFFAALEYALGVEHAMIHVGPLTHAAGNYLVPYFLRGARNIVLPRFDPDELQATVARERATHLLLVPTMITRLLEALKPDRYDLGSLSRINYGTAPMPVEVLRRGLEAFGPVFRQHYGLTEAPQPLTVLYPHEHCLSGPEAEMRRLASCGRTVMNMRLAIRGDDGRELPAGEIGEITIEAVGAGAVAIWNNPALERELIRDGWTYTGDLGWIDEDGYLFIVGRKKDMIITGGFNVYSREVEEAIHRHPDVLEVAVFGVPDPEWGESICAMVVPKEGRRIEPAAVIEHCRELIAGYKKPRQVEIVDGLLKNNSGKIDKAALRRDYLARRGRGEAQGVLARYEAETQ